MVQGDTPSAKECPPVPLATHPDGERKGRSLHSTRGRFVKTHSAIEIYCSLDMRPLGYWGHSFADGLSPVYYAIALCSEQYINNRYECSSSPIWYKYPNR